MSKVVRSYGLGMDAGGTFTDAAVVDLGSGAVLSKCKSPTMKDDLPGSIRNSLDGLDWAILSQCSVVSLSTTFATNAIVEGKGARAGAVLLGFDEIDAAGVQAARKVTVAGKHDVRGREVEPLDTASLASAIRWLVDDEHVQAIAVSGMGGARNPAHELAAKRVAREITDLPIVCGHELSMELNAIKRATTAYLNARLLPVVVNLISAVEGELRGRGITAPIVVVRSDGSLMSAREALSCPIHTIFSGPAASAIGALYLSGLRDAVIVDIGGTTTDILFAESGEIGLSSRGSVVNGFAVSTPSVAGHTTGFGGDSHIRLDRLGGLTIGPQRVGPICALGSAFGRVTAELREKLERPIGSLCQPVDYYGKGWMPPTQGMSPRELEILAALEDGPLSREAIASAVGAVDPYLVSIDRLERAGMVVRWGLTPTDVQHAIGAMDRWNSEASRAAVEVYAGALGVDSEELCRRVLDEVRTRVAAELAVGTLEHGRQGRGSGDVERVVRALMTVDSPFISLSAGFTRPVIGIGAPVAAYLPGACERLGATPLIPEHAEVANAVGAVAGRITVSGKSTVSPMETGYSVHTPLDCADFDELEPAEAHAARMTRAYVESRVARDYEGLRFRFDVSTDHRCARGSDGESVLVESTVRCTAVCDSVPG